MVAVLLILTTGLMASAASLKQVTNLTSYGIDDDEINLKWSKVSSVDGYQVFLYNSGTKKWTKLGNTKKTYFEADDLMSAKAYKFRVRVYKKASSGYDYSPYVTLLAATAPDEVDNLKASAKTKNTVTLKWNAVKRATGYQVFMYDASQGKYVRKAVTAKTTAKISSLKEGTNYKFKVKAYFKANSKYYYGEYSDVLTVKTTGTAATTAATSNNGVVGVSKAGTLALTHAGLSKSQVRGYECKLDRENGITVYEVEFVYGNYEYEYEINATTGKIISVEKSRDD